MEIKLLKELREENFGHRLQQLSFFFISGLQTQLKTLTHIVDEKEAGTKDVIIIISLLIASQKLLVSEVLKFVKLILTVSATNAVSERSCSTSHRFKTYLRSSLAQELLSSCLILATYKEKVDKLKLVK